MDSIQNIYTNNMVKEQVTTWAARMPAYCYTELCPDPTLRRTGGLKKIMIKIWKHREKIRMISVQIRRKLPMVSIISI